MWKRFSAAKVVDPRSRSLSLAEDAGAILQSTISSAQASAIALRDLKIADVGFPTVCS
jgi:hypothetical protein